MKLYSLNLDIENKTTKLAKRSGAYERGELVRIVETPSAYAVCQLFKSWEQRK